MSDNRPEVLTDPLTRTVYATDNSIYQVEPAAVALPTSPAEVARLVADEVARPDPRPIVARGGGTGTNGQSLTDGLVIDVKRRLNRVIDIDPAGGRATVEPGVVTAALNRQLATHGLFWAPHTSTLNRATVGGMISTDAAGKGSLVHGRAHRHVLALDVVLDDGTPWRAEPIPVADAEARAAVDDRIGRLWRDLLALPIAEGDRFALPELARGFSGYGIDRFRRDGLVDPLALLCGAEGTLAVLCGATLRLTPLPTEVTLVVAGYATFADALEAAVDLAATNPTAIETLDETTLERGRSSPAWPALGDLIGDGVGSVLLLEYAGDRAVDVAAIEAAIRAQGASRSVRVAGDAEQRAGAWKVRADAVGLLAKVATLGSGHGGPADRFRRGLRRSGDPPQRVHRRVPPNPRRRRPALRHVRPRRRRLRPRPPGPRPDRSGPRGDGPDHHRPGRRPRGGQRWRVVGRARPGLPGRLGRDLPRRRHDRGDGAGQGRLRPGRPTQPGQALPPGRPPRTDRGRR